MHEYATARPTVDYEPAPVQVVQLPAVAVVPAMPAVQSARGVSQAEGPTGLATAPRPAAEGKAVVPARPGSRLDASKLAGAAKAVKGVFKDVVEGDREADAKSATGGIGAALLSAVGKSASALMDRSRGSVTDRNGTRLEDMELADRIALLLVLRHQRAVELERMRRGQGVADRATRAVHQRERAAASGRVQRTDLAERGRRVTTERVQARTVDGGTLRGRRIDGSERMRAIMDARRTIDARATSVGVAAPSAARVTGAVRPMRLASPMPAPSQLAIAAPRAVAYSPPVARAQVPGMQAERGNGIAAAMVQSITRGR